MRLLAFIAVISPQLLMADERLAEVQELFTKWQLYEGPIDGELNPDMVRSLTTFFDHRGTGFDGSFDDEEYLEVLGQTDVSLPQTDGFELCDSHGFPSHDTYKADESDPGQFSVTLRQGDYDRKDYRGWKNFYNTGTQNLSRQNATLHSCEWLEPGNTYVVAFDAKISHPSIGSFFLIRSESPDGAVEFQVFPGSVRVGVGSATPVAAYRREVFDEWLTFRVEFALKAGAPLPYRVFVNEELGLESTGEAANFSFSDKGALLVFGSDRGKSSLDATASFRDIQVSQKEGE